MARVLYDPLGVCHVLRMLCLRTTNKKEEFVGVMCQLGEYRLHANLIEILEYKQHCLANQRRVILI